MADTIDAYSLASRGVVVDKSDVHTQDAELLHAQNWQVDAVGGRGSLRRRDGMLALNATALAGPVLGGIGVPLADASALTRTFYLAMNDGIHSFRTSTDGVTWTVVSTPTRPVREFTLGLDPSTPFGDHAMFWQGFGNALYYPGDDYSTGAQALPSLHKWDGTDDSLVGHIPINPLDLNDTSGPFGITSLVPYSATQLLIVVADRNSSGQGRSRVLLLDVGTGSFQQLGASAVLNKGHVITGIAVWQKKVWIAGVNISTGQPLVTFWINPGEAEWTQDDSYGTQRGYCTGLAVFKGQLYQATAAENTVSAVIRRRAQDAISSATATTSVQVGNTTVSGGSSTVAGGSSTVAARPVPASIAVGPLSGGGVPDQSGEWRVRYTFKYADGVESLPSPVSAAVSITAGGANNAIVLTGQLGDANVAQRLIYLKPPNGSTYLGNATQTFYNTPGVFTIPDNTTTTWGVSAQIAGSTRQPPASETGYAAGSTFLYVEDCAMFEAGGGSAIVGSDTFTYTGRTAATGVGALTGVSGIGGTIAVGSTITPIILVGATSIPIADTATFPASGAATVGANTIAYTGRSTASGPGSLTGVTGVSAVIPAGTAIGIIIPIGATVVPLADMQNFPPTGTAIVAGQTLTYTGQSTTTGAGNLTGVSGIGTALVGGSAIVGGSVPIAATLLPIADTTNFLSAGGAATAAGQALTYTGRSTTSGRGFLTGVSGITPAIANGATVSVTTVTNTVWTTVHTSSGTGLNNYLGPFIVTQDGGTILAWQHSVSGGATPYVRVLQSVDGTVWTQAYDVSGNLSTSYSRSGMPLLDDNGDIYWPIADAGSATGGVLKRTAAGVWSVVLSATGWVRGPLGLIRT